jgi:GT2 family glycosyltransferase
LSSELNRGDATEKATCGSKVSVIVLNLNGYEDTRECLASLRKVRYPNFDVVLVDNGSSDNSGYRLEREFPDVKFIRSERNTGFTGGNNLGIRYALDGGASYVLMLNNDTIVSPDFLEKLVEVAETDSGIGIVGPKILYASDPQRIWFAGGYIRHGSGACHHVGLNELDQPDKYREAVDSAFITGCAMLVKSEVFRKIGLLDDKLFCTFEDVDFCMRATEVGSRSVFVPASRIWHKISQTVGLQSPFTLYLCTRNQLNWVAKYVPQPYTSGALALTFVKKFVRMILFSFKNRDLAVAVWQGMRDFAFHIYGPPRVEWLPKRQLSQAPTRPNSS